MTELERVTNNIDKCVQLMNEDGVQRTKVSLCLITQTLIEISKELAIMNDNYKKER